MKRILCLWLPNWPVQRLLRVRPELKGRTLVLQKSDGRGRRVAACSARAAAEGVRLGMPVAEAKSLVPALMVAPYEAAADRRALEQLAEACERFSPCVGLEEANEPDSLLMDVSNLAHLWGSDEELASRVAKFFAQRGYRARLAAADTVGLAWAVAHFGERDCKMQNEKCNLQFAICNTLPIEALRISEETAELLRQLGIETLGQLWPLPREDLATRFGDELLRRLDQLTGAARETITPHRGMAPLVAEQTLEQPTPDRELLTHVLRQLAERLARELAARDQGAVLIICSLRCAGGETVRRRIGLLEPSASTPQWMELIELHLENLSPQDEVAGVQIRVAVAARLGHRQGELFAAERPIEPRQLAVLVARLSSRLGDEQVVRPERRPSPVPERAVRYIAATERSTVHRRELQIAKCKLQNATNWGDGRQELRVKSQEPESKLSTLDSRLSTFSRGQIDNLQFAICSLQSAPRPLLLQPQPQAIEVVCVAPDGPPQFVWLNNRRERIVHHAGPERIETLWWRGRSVRRDYYRAITTSGRRLWVFRRLHDGRWFLHGIFD